MRLLSIALFTLALAAAGRAGSETGAPQHDPRAAHAETDQNGDGQIDREEFHVRMVEVFFHGDADKDGFMTPAELAAVTVVSVDFAAADRNGDGRLALYEFIEVRFDDFQEADTDADGRLSVDEVVAAFER